MGSEATVADGSRSLEFEDGEQVMVLLDSGDQLVERLPSAAFENLLLVTTREQPGGIETTIRERGGEPARVGVVPVTGVASSYDGPMTVADRVAPNDLTGISIGYSELMGHVRPDGWVAVDNVTILLMYAEHRLVFRLMNSIVAATRERGATGVYAFARDVMADDTYNEFRGLFDRIVDLHELGPAADRPTPG